ncbi:hypothetical protein V490_00321 [Pseudogymnoascus sp. VKM F-3557]|nr:hypothetical protein V490_00321 [Pseudogymnoascus sp. VKM F-3557]
MEVFVRGAPERATETQMTTFFQPVLSGLSIENWHCEKWKQKRFATLTFLNEKDGNKFLGVHGQARNDQRRSTPLMFQGAPLLCSLSNKSPDPFALKSLEMDLNARKAGTATNQTSQSVSGEGRSSLECSFVSCGLWDYVGSDLVFTSYQDLVVPGSVKFGSKAAVIKLNTNQRIDIPYSTAQQITTEGLPQPAITITLSESPHFFKLGNGGDLTNITPTMGVDYLTRLMGAFATNPTQGGQSRQRVSGLDTEHEKISGNCLVYRIGLVSSSLSEQMKALSHARGIPPAIRRYIDVRRSKERYGREMNTLLQTLATSYATLPFKIAYQVQKLAQNGYLSPNKVLELLPEISRLSRRSELRVCISAIRRLFNQIPFRGPDTDSTTFQLDALISLLKVNEEQFKSGGLYLDEPIESENVALIHRITVTPAGIYLFGPEPEQNNRILRKYPKHHNYFLRVQFCDENGDQVQYNPGVSNDTIFYGRFKKILDEGIPIAGRQFSFLGFSHSSLRAQSCWFMSPFFHNGSLLLDRMLIEGLGDFSNIRCPAKCAARIGQAFSETPTAITLKPSVAKVMNDVERNGRVFSDGVGTVSMSVIKQIWDSLPRARQKKTTLFQIRYSGAKGMIALDSRLQGHSLYLRKSMIKFPGSDSTDIEICGAAYRPLPLYLNHQSIKILEDMGVKEEFFLSHQAKEVERLRMVTSSPTNASIFLKTQNVGDLIHLPWFINKLNSLGLSFQEDSFLRDIIEITVLIELRALKHKARIPIPGGYTLHGIMDETGILEEGQIFCIVEINGKPKVIAGKELIITRAPALHKGDIQIVTAVTVPAHSPLMSLRNCICFSQKGSRDLPSKLSGGDLDGDLYQIIFDPMARPKWVFPPADYHSQTPVELNRPVERKDMTDFFVRFMATDQLGGIAVLHKVLADQRERGVLDPDCLLLAEMHSTAVDFSKSGIPVSVKMPRYNKFRPDFMAPGPHVHVQNDKPLSFDTSPEPGFCQDDDDVSGHKYYKSDKILGKLYRAIDEREVFGSVQQEGLSAYMSEVNKKRSSVSSVLENVWDYVQYRCQAIQWKHHLDRAWGIRDEYEDCVTNIASEFSSQPSRAISEREVFVGNILGKSGAQNKRQHELSISMKERFNEDLTYIVNCIVKDGAARSEESLARSIACFKVGLEPATCLKTGVQLLTTMLEKGVP